MLWSYHSCAVFNIPLLRPIKFQNLKSYIKLTSFWVIDFAVSFTLCLWNFQNHLHFQPERKYLKGVRETRFRCTDSSMWSYVRLSKQASSLPGFMRIRWGTQSPRWFEWLSLSSLYLSFITLFYSHVLVVYTRFLLQLFCLLATNWKKNWVLRHDLWSATLILDDRLNVAFEWIS